MEQVLSFIVDFYYTKLQIKKVWRLLIQYRTGYVAHYVPIPKTIIIILWQRLTRVALFTKSHITRDAERRYKGTFWNIIMAYFSEFLKNGFKNLIACNVYSYLLNFLFYNASSFSITYLLMFLTNTTTVDNVMFVRY